jgi:hypothetical protein
MSVNNSIIPTVANEDVPKSFTTSPDRPFEMVGVRDQYLKLFDRNNQRLTEEEVVELANQPLFSKNTERLTTLSDEANVKRKQEYNQTKFYKMSLEDLAYRVSDTWSDVLDDTLTFDTSDGIRGFLEIFIVSDRLVYLGITLFIFTILVLMIRSV